MLDGGASTTLYMSVFVGMLPAGALYIPLVAAMLRRLGSTASMQVVTLASIAFGALACIPTHIEVQLLTFVVYIFYRSALFSVATVRTAAIFGPKAMGTMYGALLFVGACQRRTHRAPVHPHHAPPSTTRPPLVHR